MNEENGPWRVSIWPTRRHLAAGKIFDRATLFMQLVIHVLLGYRALRDAGHYQERATTPYFFGQASLFWWIFSYPLKC